MDEQTQFDDWQQNHIDASDSETRLTAMCQSGNTVALSFVKRRAAAGPSPGQPSKFPWGEPRIAVDSLGGADKQPYSGLRR